VRQWLVFFPRAQLLVLRQEQLAVDPGGTLARAAAHVGLTPLPAAAAAYADTRPNALAANRAGGKYRAGMLPATRALLAAFYAPYNAQLAALLGDPALAYNASA
jgi:hypothetical protein